MKFISLFVFLFFSLVQVTHAALNEAIPGHILFSENEHKTMILRPDGKYIASYDKEGDMFRIDLIDMTTLTAYTLITLEDIADLVIEKMLWLDNKHLYIETFSKKGVLKIDDSEDKPKSKWHPIYLKGSIISTLPKQPQKVLFDLVSRRHKSVVYYLTIDDLLASNKKNAEVFPDQDNEYNTYYYDDNADVLLKSSLESIAEGIFTVSFYDSVEEEWVDIWTSKKGEEVSYIPIGFLSKDILAVLTNQDTNLNVLMEYNVKTKSFGKLLYSHPMYDLIGADLNEINNGVKSVSYIENGMPVTEYFGQSEKYLMQKLAKTFPGKAYSVVDASHDNKIKIIAVFGSDMPVTLFYYDDDNNRAAYIKNQKESLTRYDYSEAKTFHVKTEDGESIEAIYTEPLGEKNGVLLVFPHGGPVGVRDVAVFNPQVQYFTSRGYSVLNINFRGSTGFGKKFLEQGKGQFGRVIEKDISTVVQQIEKEHTFTHKCAIGASYGGYSSMMLAIHHPEEYQCIVSMFGIFDLPHLFNASNEALTEEYQKSLTEVIGENTASLKEVSPFYLADKVNSPVLIIAGKDDEISHFEQSNRMKYRLKQLNKDVEFFPYKGVGHGHHSYYGNIHQFALVDEYISRKLKLERPASSMLAKELHELGYAHLARSFNSEVDLDKAEFYLKQSAEMGNVDAMFDLANIYSNFHERFEDNNLKTDKRWFSRTTFEKKNPEKAVYWYAKASKAGSHKASITLANIYYSGFLGEKKVKKAFSLYKKASVQGDEAADFYIARAQCLGSGAAINIDACLDKLFFNFVKKYDTYWHASRPDLVRNAMIAEILNSPSFVGEQRKRLLEKVHHYYAINDMELVDDGTEFGHYYYDEESSSGIHVKNKTVLNNLSTRHSLWFELKIKDKKASIFEKKSPKTYVRVHWSLPEGLASRNSDKMWEMSLKYPYKLYFTFPHESMLVSGDWTVTIYDLNDNLLFKKTFITDIKKPEARVEASAIAAVN